MIPRRASLIQTTNDDTCVSSSIKTTTCTSTTMNLLDWNKISSERYGQEDEYQSILDSYQNRLTEREFILISGSSGTGKTSLASSIGPTVRQDGGYLVCGQCQRNKSAPYGAFVEAFTTLLRQISEDQMKMKHLRKILSKSETELRMLWEAFPALHDIIFEDPDDPIDDRGTRSNKGMHAYDVPQHIYLVPMASTLHAGGSCSRRNIFILAWRKLTNAISSIGPLVLILDDLQWCDPCSLALFDAVLSAKDEKSCFMLMATCQWNKVSRDDGVDETLQSLKGKGIRITEIRLTNLSDEVVTEMVSDLVQLSAEECLTLSDYVFRQTKGNAFFVRQLLQSLDDQQLLRPKRIVDGIWKWDEDDIRTLKKLSENAKNAKSLVSRRLWKLPNDVQEVLRVSASLGMTIDVSILCHLVPYRKVRIDQALKLARNDGYITFDETNGSSRFLHQQIQQAALDLIPDEDEDIIHLNNGQKLWESLDQDEFNKYIFVVVDQLILGDVDNIDQHQVIRNKMSELCLQAAREAAFFSDYSSASTYIGMGLNLLNCRNQWELHYELCLEAFSYACELHFHAKNYYNVDTLHKQTLNNAESFEDKLRSYVTHIYSLCERGDFDNAMVEGRDVLNSLGHPIATKNAIIKKFHTKAKVVMTGRKLKGMTDDVLLNLPHVTDTNVFSAMNILCVLYTYLFAKGGSSKHEYGTLLSMKMIDLTLEFGLCPWSCIGLTSYAMMMISKTTTDNSLEEAYRLGQLAIKIFDSNHFESIKARLYMQYFGYLHSEKNPVRSCVEPLMEAYKDNLQTDLEASLRCAGMRYYLHPFLGTALSEVVDDLINFHGLCNDYCQPSVWSMHEPTLQLALYLIGKKDYSQFHDFTSFGIDRRSITSKTISTDGDFDEEDNVVFNANNQQDERDDVQTQQQEGKKKHIVLPERYDLGLMLVQRYFLAVYVDDESIMEPLDNIEKKILPNIQSSGIPPFAFKTYIFHKGLVSIVLASQTKHIRERRKYISQAKDCLMKLKKYASTCPANYRNKQYLLEAEIFAYGDNFDRAIPCYEKAIDAASEEGFVHEQALACEKAGKALLQIQQHNPASVVESSTPSSSSKMSQEATESAAYAYLKRSNEFYMQWGASVKVNQINDIVGETETELF